MQVKGEHPSHQAGERFSKNVDTMYIKELTRAEIVMMFQHHMCVTTSKVKQPLRPAIPATTDKDAALLKKLGVQTDSAAS